MTHSDMVLARENLPTNLPPEVEKFIYVAMEKVRTAYSLANIFRTYGGTDNIDIAYRTMGQKMIDALDISGG